jgi:hypothetical protein
MLIWRAYILFGSLLTLSPSRKPADVVYFSFSTDGVVRAQHFIVPKNALVVGIFFFSQVFFMEFHFSIIQSIPVSMFCGALNNK